MSIKRNLPDDEYQAALAANNPTAANPFATIADTGGGGGSVNSVTGLNTDNTDSANPIVKIAVDNSTITGTGTVADPLVSVGGIGDLVSTNNLSDVDNAVTSLSNLGGEPSFTKNTGFNKAFGTTAGTVAQGNHTHPGAGWVGNATSQLDMNNNSIIDASSISSNNSK